MSLATALREPDMLPALQWRSEQGALLSIATDVAAGLASRLDAGLNWDLADLSLADGELVGMVTEHDLLCVLAAGL